MFVKPERLVVVEFGMERRERQLGEKLEEGWCRVSLPIIPRADRGAARPDIKQISIFMKVKEPPVPVSGADYASSADIQGETQSELRQGEQ